METENVVQSDETPRGRDVIAQRSRGHWWPLLAALGMALATACGGGGGGGGSDDDTGGGSGVSSSDLAGTWGGTIETPDPGIGALEVDFDSQGDITAVLIDGLDQDITGDLRSKTTSSARIFTYDFDGTEGAIFVDSAAAHAGVLLEDGTVGVIEKGTTSGSFNPDDAAGTWSGEAVYVLAPFEEDRIDSVSATFSTTADGISADDVAFTGPDGSCSGIAASLGSAGGQGVYDQATLTGGSGDGDCPGSDTLPADTYMSYDADFMVVYAGCEAGEAVDECSLAVLSRTGPAAGDGGSTGGSGGGSDDGGSDSGGSGTDDNGSATPTGLPAGGVINTELMGINGDEARFRVDLFVVDADGNALTGLLGSDFTQSGFTAGDAGRIEFSRDQAFAASCPPKGPYSAVTLMDQTGSIETTDPGDARIAAAKDFMEVVGIQDEVLLAAFARNNSSLPASGIGIFPPFRNNGTSYFDELDSFAGSEGGSTPLFDAVIASVGEVAQNGQNANKAVVVFTDGDDTSSSSTLNDAVTSAQSSGVDLYTVGLSSGTDEEVLSRLADRTGGAFMQASAFVQASDNARQLISLFRALGKVMKCEITLYRTEWTMTREFGTWSNTASVLNAVEVDNVPGLSFALPIQYRLAFQ